MEDKNFNLMTAVLFVFNGLAAAIAIIIYILGAMPARESQFGLWLFGIIMMSLYGIAMLFIIGFAVFYEYRKTIVEGPEFFVYDFRKTCDNETEDTVIMGGSRDPSWNINFLYTLVNKGDCKARFRYEVLMTLDVNDDDGNPLEAYAMQLIVDKTLGPSQDSLDELLTFIFRPKEKAEQWSEGTIHFKVNYKDHDFNPQSIDFHETILRNP